MKRLKWLTIVVVGVLLASCNMIGPKDKEPVFQLSDLQGLWLQDNDPTEHYVRFTTEQSDETGYLYGREWNEYYGDEDQAVYESDLFESLETLGVHGDGWFKYKFETNGNITEIHLMDNGGAEIPKVYIVSKLTDTELVYYEKEYKNLTYQFSRIVEK